MDPKKSQSDADKEANSLESPDTVVEDQPKNTGETGHTNTSATNSSHDEVIDATHGAGSPSINSPKPPLLKRLWQRFNIYFLLFILLFLIAIGGTVTLFMKDNNAKQAADRTIDSQSLSDSALKQLANSDVTVGNTRQILKVESNAIFSGSVLIRNDLEVAGSIKVGKDLQLPGITVSGDSRFNQLQANNLTVGSNATVQGSLVANKGITVKGTSTFDNVSAAQITTTAFQLNGELRLTNHITAGGPNPGLTRGGAVGSGGTASVSGSDTTGSIVINTGSDTGAGCFATIIFVKRFNSTPHVVVTPVGSAAAGVNYYINRNSSEFSVCTASPAPAGQTFGFDYIVLN